MKKTKTNDGLQTDDEAMRAQGMISGDAKVSRWTLRPTTVTDVSWMQRNHVLESKMDIIWRAAAFAYIHSAPKPDVRSVVNSPDDFIDAVDTWMDANCPDSDEITQLSKLMGERISEWFSSSSETNEPSSPGN